MRPAPTPAPRVPAVAAMMADRFDDREWFGMGDGAMVEQAPAAPAAPAEAFLIEPPPWEGQIALAAPPEPEPLPPMNAVEALKADEAWEPPDLDLSPAMVTPPLQRPTFPAPDWRREETEVTEQVLPKIESPGVQWVWPAPKGRP